MCGICGIVGLEEKEALRKMVAVMRHRGPDDEGIHVDTGDHVGLGHRRLSIIDLSRTGHQPMADGSGRYLIVYNGEIYNYRELKEELAGKGYTFASRSDTEVILYAYREWGRECPRHLRGMFAFAIYDRGDAHGPAPKNGGGIPPAPYLFLARDRFGIKPLVFQRTPRAFIFASELKALLASGMIERKADPAALYDYVLTGSVYQPKTILKDVYHLAAGHGMFVDAGGGIVRTYKYWDLYENTRDGRRKVKDISYRERTERLKVLLDDAVRAHLVSDVPVGAFLSGGIDSTTLVALMTKHLSSPIKSFSVGFEKTDECEDELSYAKIAARHLGCDHTEIVVTPGDIAARLDAIVESIDQPSVDGTNAFVVSSVTGRSVKVALSGIGGDELFAGYRHFPLVEQGTMHIAGIRDIIPRSEIRHILEKGIAARIHSDAKRPYLEQFMRTDLDAIARVSYAECRGYLQSTLLRDGDAMSMAHSLEIRPVYLDHCLAEYVFSLPGPVKIRNGIAKSVLIDAVRDMVPETAHARAKVGFRLPFATWMTGVLRDRLLASFSSSTAKRVFSKEYIKKVNRAVKKKEPSPPIWAWFILLEWMSRYDIDVSG